MPRIELPDGDYIHACRAVRLDSGGRTRAMLMRARFLAEYGEVRTKVTTYDDDPHYPEVRARLREWGLLPDGVELVNIYEYFRSVDLDARLTVRGRVPSVDGIPTRDDTHPDGSAYRTTYTPAGSKSPAVIDYRRADGSTYLRVQQRNGKPARHVLLNGSGQPVGRWRHRTGWIRSWLEELSPAGRAFVITDKPAFAMSLRGLPPRFHLLDLMHNPHVGGKRRWDSPIRGAYKLMFEHIAELDGLVSLTDRQRQDVVRRCGETDNLFVVPNPVVAPRPPDRLPVRERARFTVIARLEKQKQLEHALRAFARVVEQEPQARLDIYGHGDRERPLRRLSGRLGLDDTVTFHGFDPNARSSLWTATGFLMTSRHEGYPLATLEAMSHGCPVVSYDLKYGPRDQITDGVDGLLVEQDDIVGAADAMLGLIREPELAQRMGAAAIEKAAQHDPEAFVRDWKHVFERVVEQAATRTQIASCDLRVTRLGYARRAHPLDRLRRPPPTAGADDAGRRIEVRALLDVRGPASGVDLDSARLVVQAICVKTGEIADVAVSVRLRGGRFRVSGQFVVDDLFAHDAPRVRLRELLTWHNCAWQQPLARITRSGGVEAITAL